jgi:2-iminoacetate synthase
VAGGRRGWYMTRGMEHFRLDEAAVRATRERALALAASPGAAAIAARVRSGEPAGDEELAALVISPHVPTEELLAAARDRRPAGGPRIETFSPLYITNECDAECLMCGMRRTNEELVRETADAGTVERQLDVLHRRGIRAVAVLSGEYHFGARRTAMIERAAAAVRAALARGFAHVLVNIGALDAPEYALLLDGVPRRPDGRIVPQLTMCTFQETYNRRAYARFMGTSAENPRSLFERRLTNFDRARDAGMWSANPGVLLGLDPDVASEVLALLAHVRHLERRGMTVYVSLPRLRRATGTPYPAGIGDDALCRVVAVLALGTPESKVVISTREPPAMQRRLLPVIGVLTPGSPGVAPYTETGARFALEASQFEVLDHRPIEAILGEFLAAGATIDGYEPAPRA